MANPPNCPATTWQTPYGVGGEATGLVCVCVCVCVRARARARACVHVCVCVTLCL